MRAPARRQGQTLAEFALTLPILLILIFGIIEFGRIFQAWVTLQNSARTAARFASTGQPFNDDRQTQYVLDNIVPCTTADARGTVVTYPTGAPAGSAIQIYQGGAESTYATVFGGRNCDPGNTNDNDLRGDIVRLVLIYLEARRGAAGLALEPNLYNPQDPNSVRQFFLDSLVRPLPRSDQPGWFNMLICSSRTFLDPASTSLTPGVTTRFQTILNGDPRAPLCMLNEVQPAGGGATANAGRPWLDTGGPGDAISIVVQFNHPLITPLGLAQFIPLQARRSAVNESFRSTNAVSGLQGGPAIGGGVASPTPTDSPTPLPPTNTPLPPTSTFTPTVTHTASPIPVFQCSGIQVVGTVSFFSNRAQVYFNNNNAQPTTLERVELYWRATQPGMYMSMMTFTDNVIWQGTDDSSPTFTNQVPDNAGWVAGSERTLFNTSATGPQLFEAYFLNGPANVGSELTIYDFANTRFYFMNPVTGQLCIVALNLPTPTPSPTRNPLTPVGTPSATGTPDCASNLLRLEAVSFNPFGVVELRVVNNRTVIAPFTNFDIRWAPMIARAGFAPGVITLRQVRVGAAPNTTVIWDSGNFTQDADSPTIGKSEGVWGWTAANPAGNINFQYNFQPNSVTPVYLDFDGIVGPLTDIGAQWADFNSSWFEIWCGTRGTGGTGGPGGSPSGIIQLNNGGFPTAVPTNTQRPTNTPGPTLTPSRTFTPAPPTSTPRPATATPTVPTPTHTTTPSPAVEPTNTRVGNTGTTKNLPGAPDTP